MFLTNSVPVYVCAFDEGPVSENLERPQFGMYDISWPGEVGIEYHLSHGDWIRLLGRHGFEVQDLAELQAPPGALTHGYYDFVTAEWARKWPAEEIWVARLRA